VQLPQGDATRATDTTRRSPDRKSRARRGRRERCR
jgi:hypothetical protein